MRSGTEGTYNGLNYASWGTKRHLDDSKVHSSPCLTPVWVAWRSKEYWLNPPSLRMECKSIAGYCSPAFCQVAPAFSGTHLYPWAERGTERIGRSCQRTQKRTQARARILDPDSSTRCITPLAVPTWTKGLYGNLSQFVEIENGISTRKN